MRLHVPLVSGLTPIRAWLAGNKQGLAVGVGFFIDEAVFTNRQFEVADTVDTNKKVALFTDNEQDGQVMGTLWEQNAPKHGYDVVYHAKFPSARPTTRASSPRRRPAAPRSSSRRWCRRTAWRSGSR